jgi:hypothetical protein
MTHDMHQRHTGADLLGRTHARRSDVAQPHGQRTRGEIEHKTTVRDVVGHIMSASNRDNNQPLNARLIGRVLGSRHRRT